MNKNGRKVYEAECPWCFFNFCYLLSTGKSYSQYECYLCGIPFRQYAKRMLTHPVYEYIERKGERLKDEED